MPSRLSSLLVRDGLVGVKRMEKAFQRQVIYGGSLDTILLEMSLVPEERLTQYLALAFGLPPAARDEGHAIEPAALALMTAEVAERYHAVPLALEGEAVRVLVCSPLELSDLEDLADLLDRPLQPLIAPEFRWYLVLAAAYGMEPPARFTTLARSLDVDPTLTPVGRPRTIIIEERRDAVPAPIPARNETTERTASLADATTRRTSEPLRPPAPIAPAPIAPAPIAPAPIAPAPRREPSTPPATKGRSSTLLGVKAITGDGTPGAVPDAVPVATVPVATVPVATATASAPTSRPSIQFLDNRAPTERRPGSDAIPTRRRAGDSGQAGRSASVPISTVGRDEPMAIHAAREQLAIADDRDGVFLTLLRAARSRARWAGLLTVQGGVVVGRVAIAEEGLDTAAVQTALIPLDAASPFRTVTTSHQPMVSALVTGDPSIDSMMLRFGGAMPPTALLLPIVLRERVVAIVVVHRVNSRLELADVTELLPLAHAASEALGRLIVRLKSAGYRAPTAAPSVEIDADSVKTRKYAAEPAPDGPWQAPTAPDVPVIDQNIGQGVDIPITTDPPRPVAAILDDIERAREGQAEDALSEALERATELFGELATRFPGTLRIQRFTLAGRPMRAAQYGGLLELVVRLGGAAGELLVEKLTSAQRDVRFFAAVCCVEVRPPSAMFTLAERLFDQDFGVRAVAIEALAGYPVADLKAALTRARRAVHASDPEVVAAAAAALVELGDTEGVPDLIAALERGDRASEHARRALVTLTAQDFGTSERKWRRWFEGAKHRHRIEWLIEGLVHKEDAIRETAINVLRRLTGEYFGYHHDLPRRDRDAAAARWISWWRDAGLRRFMPPEDQRLRPTGVLPARHEPR